jgi:hypothetical protein
MVRAVVQGGRITLAACVVGAAGSPSCAAAKHAAKSRAAVAARNRDAARRHAIRGAIAVSPGRAYSSGCGVVAPPDRFIFATAAL